MFVKLNYLFMIRTGILGTSGTANLFAEILKDSDRFELTGCFSPDIVKMKAFANQHSLYSFATAESLYSSCEALIITDFSPDFLSHTEKAIKSFKHILITNPFLAGLEEIQHLRKLSEESGVIMQIFGGFKFQTLFPGIENINCFYADLKHSFSSEINIYCNPKFMEYLLCDISLLLIVLKGMTKKVNINSWDISGRNMDLLSARLELDNGCIANILIGDVEDKNNFTLSLYGVDGINKFESKSIINDLQTLSVGSAVNELAHFEKIIKNKYITPAHNDVMLEALELAHKIKAKITQNFAVNFSD